MTISYTPQQIQTAYGFNLIVSPQGKPLGYGIKVAIIVAYHYPNAQSDLNKYCSKYSLIPITLNIINQAGNVTNSSWAIEECLTTQMINTVAPGCTLYVIEAKSSIASDLNVAVTTAVNLGVNVICLTFGISEFSTELSYDPIFMNSNITFLAPTGDISSVVNYPCVSTNVLAVGGTTLKLNSDNSRKSETIWSNSGCGISAYISKPTYQSNVNTGSKRNVPDVSLIADNNYGFIIYCSISSGYFPVGGTTLSNVLMTGIVTIANQLRKNVNKPMLTSLATSTYSIQNYLYKTIYTNSSLYSTCMYDITSGTDGIYVPDIGYDICSGLGSINANNFCTELSNI